MADRETLLAERNVILEMARQVRYVDPSKREGLNSPLLHSLVHDAITVPDEIVDRVGEIHDIYRRFRRRLIWPGHLNVHPE